MFAVSTNNLFALRRTSALLLTLATAWAIPAHSDTTEPVVLDVEITESSGRTGLEDVALSTPTGSTGLGAGATWAAETQRDKEKAVDIVTLPVPLSNPTIGSGLALASMLLYKIDENSPASSTTLGALYTDTSTWGAGLSQKTYFGNDKYRFNLLAGYANANLKFFGVGSGVGDHYIPINQSGYLIDALFQREIADELYFGIGYKYLSLETRIDLNDIIPEVELPTIGVDVVTSALLLNLEYDSRDNPLNPGSGKLIKLQADFFHDSIGSDLTYQKYRFAYNQYQELAGGTMAVRATACGVEGTVPFYDYCLFGSENSLRGYITGQYRDRRMLTFQGEYRRTLFGRFGAVVFAGVGEVAPSFAAMNGDNLLPSVGVGLRYLASKKNDVNVSIDYAVGKDSDAVYFYIGEAF